MFIGMAAPPYEYSELEGCMDTDRDPPFLFTGSYREAWASTTCPTIDFDDRFDDFLPTSRYAGFVGVLLHPSIICSSGNSYLGSNICFVETLSGTNEDIPILQVLKLLFVGEYSAHLTTSNDTDP